MSEMKKRRRIRALRGWLLLLVLSVFLASCLNWILEKPSFSLREITVNPRSLKELQLILGIDVHNPNRFDLTLRSFEYTITLSGEEVGVGRLEKELLIPAASTSRVQAPVSAEFKNLGGSLLSIITGKGLPYKFEGRAEVKTIIGSVTFTFADDGRL
ncbi:MAG: LEA type 2 family protein [Thermodesulfobacteriota bacterium]